ncbi:hypothetical protein ABB37_07378 [Leptomonas pyrrhocoris]|uniref:Uncharacterized protein n=1 Tax=Leptomonas pyrrhocoris TaxID=157538 RepID=A0A0N0DT81_LEPPY|nr:hypothetical protein ABB37_07378 [Leptomonas pyrrhocoris]XP_015655473.1 hypothetical protein ABB37_07378 [Leptomonas pyrrhocoris]KPA77033.1 hypothetical protein ABB37_07378 [Leptomonas pyrrhocoris]KPA77034.1 hypothetical protein ABB37_07378 [Leptomonas pyrrhocoris]|eukprot:XP_015655472.1 hypothetical protein ABB37_07378 [Leptomonas pyrrhocoris]
MPSKPSNKSGGNKTNASGSSGKGQKPNSASRTNTTGTTTAASTTTTAAAAAAPTASATSSATTAPSFDSLPHATSGERLKGVEVGSTIPALMSELGVLLQQTPGGGGGGSGGLPRGRNGGLLFEDADARASGSDAAAAVFGDDVSRRLDQISPGALERLSQVFQLQRRQAQTTNTNASANSAAASSKGGSGSPSAEAADSDDEDELDGTSGSSGATGHTTPAPAPPSTTSPNNTGPPGGGTSGSEYDAYSAAGRRHNLEEMFEMMQRSIGNYARGAAAVAAAGGGGALDGKEKPGSGVAALAGDMGLDPSAYSDPLTQLELFRAMMVATSKGRTAAGAGGAAGGAGAAGLEGKSEDTAETRARGQRSGNGGGGGAGGGGGNGGGGAGTGSGGAAGRVPGSIDLQASNPFQSFLDVLGPQLFGQVRLQQRAAVAGKAAAAAANVNGLSKDTEAATATAAVTPPSARDVDVTPNSAANLSDLQKRVEQVRVLSSSTLEELAADEVSDSTSGNLRGLLLGDPESSALALAAPETELSSAKVGYCLTEAAAVAVSMLWSYLGSQQKDAPLLLGWNREAAQRHFNLLLFRLRQELAGHSPANLTEIARCFGGGVAAEAEDVYRAINGVGVLLFFTCKPLALLEKTCAELGISLSDSANADSNIMPELIAEKLAAFFYPMKEGKLAFAHISFIPRLQVHEHAPGNYTCTIDNASNMGRMLRERLISNRFSCSKIKWRAAIVSDKEELKFLVWHRYSVPLSVHLLVRTSEPKKKKRSASAKDGGSAAENNNNGGEEKETSAADELRANSALFMERQVTAAPGEMIGFADDFLGLTVVLSSPTTLQHGYRTYNKADDRVVFQFSLQLSNTDGTSLDGGAAGMSVNKNGSKQATPQQQQQYDDAEPSVNGSVAGRTDGGDSKEDAEAEMRATVRAVVVAESAARAVLAETANLEYRHLQNDEFRGAHQSRRRAEDRERKALLAKVGPPPELMKEVDKLAQAVQAAQQQISKLSKERAKEDKENEKMAEKLAQQQGDLSKLMRTLESSETELAKLEAETKAVERRIEEKRARLARKEAKKAEQSQWTALKRVLEPTSSSTHHDTLAINDFGSFLQSTSTMVTLAAAPPPPLASGGMAATAAVYSTTVSGGMPPLSSSSGGGLTAFGTDPFSARQATTPPSSAANATPVFSTQPKMGMTTANTSGGLGANNMNTNVTAAAGASPHHPLLDGLGGNGGGGGSSSASTHPGMVSPKVPPSPGVASNASTAMGSRNSPASAMAGSLGSPGMSLASNNNPSNAVGGRSSASPSNAMMGTAGTPGGLSNAPPSAGGGLSFGLAPSLFSTNPVSHTAHANVVGGGGAAMGPGASAGSLYTSLDANAQPFSPSPPPGSPGSAAAAAASVSSNHGHSGGGGNTNHHNNGGGGFAFTVTAGAGVHPGLAGASAPLYQGGQAFSSGHELAGHAPSPFSTTPMSASGNGLFMMGNTGGGGGGANDLVHHQGMFPPQPHSSNEMLSFSTSLQWRS